MVVDDVPSQPPQPSSSFLLPSVLETPADSIVASRQPSEYFDQSTTQPSTFEDPLDSQNTPDSNHNLDATVPPGTQVQVKFDYDATKADEIDLHVGDIIVVTVASPGGWWKVPPSHTIYFLRNVMCE